jgi:hypothetical protein
MHLPHCKKYFCIEDEMNIEKNPKVSHCKTKKQIMKQPSMGSSFKHPWAVEKIGLLNKVHPKDIGERVRPEQEKSKKEKKSGTTPR